MVDIFDSNGSNIPESQQKLCFELYAKYIGLMEEDDIFTPKNHLVFHLLDRLEFQGNCKIYATWLDEGLNKTLKMVCRQTSQATFEQSVLVRMYRVLNEKALKRKNM
jgi:hypothetical protein